MLVVCVEYEFADKTLYIWPRDFLRNNLLSRPFILRLKKMSLLITRFIYGLGIKEEFISLIAGMKKNNILI